MTQASSPLDGLSLAEKKRVLAELLAKSGAKPLCAPLSFAQERLYFLEAFQPGTPTYNVPAVLPLNGRVEERLLRRSLDLLIERHECLRTQFASADGVPLQLVRPSATFDLAILDLRADSRRNDELEREIARAGANFMTAPFELQRAPLARALWLRKRDDEGLLLLCLHHIVADGWSMGILLRELSSVYASLAQGREPELQPLRLQYRDFARWQREWLSGDNLARQLAFWRQQLQGAPPLLDLPTDRPRPKLQANAGAVELFSIDPKSTSQLKGLARSAEATLFMVLLAAFYVFLARRSGQLDIVVGTPIANRTRRELEPLVGFFVNTLALRATLQLNESFRSLLARVRETTMDAYAHQELPFEKLVEELQPDRRLAHNPLFQVMLVLQNAPTAASEGAATEGQAQVNVATGTAKFDLTLALAEVDGKLEAAFEYKTELYDASTIRGMVAQFQELLHAVVQSPDAEIGALNLLDIAARRQIERWAQGAPLLTAPRSVVDRLEEQLRRADTRELTAVSDGERRLSYGELARASAALARRLRELGVGRGARVAIALPRSLECVVATVAVLRAGAGYLPLDPSNPPARLAWMLDDSQATVLLARDGEAFARPELPRLEVDLDALLAATSNDAGFDATSVRPDDCAYLMYTSGSTGVPKGVEMNHGCLGNLVAWQLEQSLPRPVTAQLAPTGFDVSFQELATTLAAGGSLVVVTEAQRRDPEQLFALCERHGVQRLFMPYVALRSLAEVARHQLRLPKRLAQVITAGEALIVTPAIRALFERLGSARLINQYGPTETHVVTSYELTGPPNEWPDRPSIGRPLPGVRVELLDEQRRPVPVGSVGELFVSGVALATGYWGQPALTAARFVELSGDAPTRRAYATGDRCRWDRHGNVHYVGRADAQLKIRGFRVELAEVEAKLQAHPHVEIAAVRALGEENRQLIAYVKANPLGRIGEAELRRWLEAELPDYMVPSRVFWLEQLPRTASGKVDRLALPEPVTFGFDGERAERVAPRTPTQEFLAGIWREVLEHDQFGIHDDFFSVGGHSLLAMRVYTRLRASLDVGLTLASLFENPTLEALANLVDDAQLAQLRSAGAGELLSQLDDLSATERAATAFEPEEFPNHA